LRLPQCGATVVAAGKAGKRMDREDVVIARPDRASLSRRAFVRGVAGAALLAGIGVAPIARAQAGTIRIGHLAPRTGPLGPLGDFAVMGVQLAAEEINAAGGVNARRIVLLLEDSADPELARAKAARLIVRDKVTLLIGDADGHRWLTCSRDTIAMPAAFVVMFMRRYGKLPQEPAWVDYVALKRAARALGGQQATGSTAIQSSRRQGWRV
jgi:hypothetical protein